MLTEFMSRQSVKGRSVKVTLRKMQYVYLALAVVSMVLAISNRVLAEEAVQGTSVSPASENRSLLNGETQNRIINLARNLIGKMQAATNRLTQITTRFDTRIIILKNSGVDTTEAEAALATAKDSLERANTILSTLDTTTVQAATAENPKEAFVSARTQYVVVREALRDAHTYLKSTLVLLKKAPMKATTENGAGAGVTTPQ